MFLNISEILSLYNAAITNAHELCEAATHMAFKYEKKKFVCLGIAELALEELGKSYALLALYSRIDSYNDWKQFWKDWRSHDVKAARAFFYEFFCTLRISLTNNDANDLGPIPRGKFSIEKEVAFYVDIDKNSRKIHIPGIDIPDEESIARVLSLLGLLSAALTIKDWMNSNQPKQFKNAISDYAYITLTENVFQQDVERVLSKLRSEDLDYNRALDEIWNLFNRSMPNDESGTN